MQKWRGFRWLVLLLALTLLLLRVIKPDILGPLSDGWQEITTGIHTLARVEGFVETVAVTPDGQTVVAGTQYEGGQIWRISDGQRLQTFGSGFVRSALAPDGELVATGERADTNRVVHIWRTKDGSLVRDLSVPPGLFNLTFAPDGQMLATTTDENVQVWRVADGTLVHTLPVNATSVAFTPDGQTLAIGSPDYGVQLWRIADWTKRATVSGWSTDFALAPDGQTGAVPPSSDCGATLLWRVVDGMVLRTLSGGTNQIHALAFAPSGTVLATSDNGGGVWLWDVTSGTLLHTLDLHISNSVEALAFSPNGQTLVMGSYQRVLLWQLPGPIAQAAKHP